MAIIIMTVYGAPCTVCSKGHYSPGGYNVPCTKCETGKYNNQTGQSKCKMCTAGKATLYEGMSSCKDVNVKCSAGEELFLWAEIRCGPR